MVSRHVFLLPAACWRSFPLRQPSRRQRPPSPAEYSAGGSPALQNQQQQTGGNHRHRPAARAAADRRAVRAHRLHRPRSSTSSASRNSRILPATRRACQVQNQSPNNAAINIRGITSDSADAFFEPRISIYQDGVSISKPRGAYVELFDIDRVEISKGPQSTLYGRGALIGAINIVQAKPDLSDTYGMVRGAYGNYDYWLGEAMVNAPLGPDGGRAHRGPLQEAGWLCRKPARRRGFPVGRDRRGAREHPLQAVGSDHRRHHRQLSEGHADRHRVQVAAFPPDRPGDRRSAWRPRHS